MDIPLFLRRLEGTLNLADRTLHETDRLADQASWDSMAVLMVIALVDREYGVTLGPETFAPAATIGDLARAVEGAAARR